MILSIGQNVKLQDQLRIWRGTRYQKEAADALGVPLWSYINWEAGRRIPSKLALKELQRRLNQNTQSAKGR